MKEHLPGAILILAMAFYLVSLLGIPRESIEIDLLYLLILMLYATRDTRK